MEINLFALHKSLENEQWQHDKYQVFFVSDPKLREIHKASVRDRVLYQAVYRALYQTFDRSFIFHSYSSRNFKGTHLAIRNFSKVLKKVSENGITSGYVLKCDVKKFFDSIDHQILIKLIRQKVQDQRLLRLIEKIIFSFAKTSGKGLPLGNVTSQLFANIYLNELDQFIKKVLGVRHYFRYCDDFVTISRSTSELQSLLSKIIDFCDKVLLLELHPRKIEIRKTPLGIDFLGYVSTPTCTVLRTKTKRRMLSNIESLKEQCDLGKLDKEKFKQMLKSYSGILCHCKGKKIKLQIKDICDKS